jgi:hypothetical protein
MMLRHLKQQEALIAQQRKSSTGLLAVAGLPTRLVEDAPERMERTLAITQSEARQRSN